MHDFRIYKENPIYLGDRIELLGDKGYQGIQKIHDNSRIPIKKAKNKSLSKEQKKFNRQLAKERITVEHVHRKLNIFRILSSRYRNRRRRFGLRLNLIAGIYNYELSLFCGSIWRLSEDSPPCAGHLALIHSPELSKPGRYCASVLIS
jgi:DDE superfamily endonuclease